MKITIANAILILISIHQICGGIVKSSVADHNAIPISIENQARTQNLLQRSPVDTNRSPPSLPPSLSPKAAANLAEKAIAALRQGQPVLYPNKQLFGGAFPSFIERVVQRIQNYFSIYNPPEYFDNRPPVTSHDEQQQPGIAIICQNIVNESLSCNPTSAEEYEEDCVPNTSQAQPAADGYNIVITQTVVQDSTVNVYSPADPSPGQILSNVVVILESSANEITPPQLPLSSDNKFYVYVNPTKANKVEMKAEPEKLEQVQPYTNATYTVFIRGHKLEEYSHNMDNVTNSSLNPDITPFVQKQKMFEIINKSPEDNSAENAVPTSRSAGSDRVETAPNINLVLVPPDHANKSCTKNKFNQANVEYYILKPDDGSLSKNKNQSNSYSLHKTNIDSISATYSTPEQPDQITLQPISSSNLTNVVQNNSSSSGNRLPLLFNLFKKRAEEPR